MTYEFRCKKCGHAWEEVRGVSQRNNKARCPSCKSYRTLRLLFSPRITANTGKGSRIPGWCNTLDKEPVYIKSKQHFKDEAKKRGMYAPNV